ncbi:MAG: hypothetical protein IJQ87_02500 [Clostridia bacterium]|nr:hypothetical protein [Clostridia bacterium]
MRKIIVLLLIFTCTFAGCKQPDPYLNYVSEVRQEIYEGAADSAKITAVYGFCETPYLNDGKTGDIIYGLTFRLHIVPDETKRVIKFTNGDREYSAPFILDEITSEYRATVEIKADMGKEFAAALIIGDTTVPVVFKSIVPDNCITYETALKALENKQSALLNSYMKDGNFSAEIYMRVFVKDGAPYWYIGIAAGKDRLKALLIDGVSGELLAVRDII